MLSGHSSTVLCSKFSPDGTLLATAGLDKDILIWDIYDNCKNFSQMSGHKNAILDIGLAASSPGNRVFAALKGMIDAGLEIPHGESVLPDEDRINGLHINENLAKSVLATKKAIEGAKK